MSESVPAGGKHALLIGIDSYPNLAEAQQLKGCVNDARQFKSVLEERFAFPSSGIVSLHNERATRDAILAALQDLRRRIDPGDVIVVGYSGHGSRVRAQDDPTGWDESIVPHDSGRAPDPNRDILDDEIHEWLLAMAERTPNVTLVFDSCFSAGITRDPFEAGSRWIPEDNRTTTGLRGRRTTGREESGWHSLGDRYTLIAGCRFDESAREIHLDQDDGTTLHHGALTYFLCRELRAAGREASSRDIFERVAAHVTAAFPAQRPLLEGRRDREPFGPRIFDTMRFLPVLSRWENHATLAGGAAHGLTPGSKWEVYAQGTHQVTPDTPRLARVRVLSVRAVDADVEVEEESGPRALAAGDRAIETDHDYGEMRLVVETCGPTSAGADLAALRKRLESSQLLRPAGPGERGAVRVYLLPPRKAAQAGDPAPRLGAIPSPVWAAVGPDGSLQSPALPVEKAGSLQWLIANLEVRARCQLAQKIENLDPESPLRDKIEVGLLRWKNRQWMPAEPDSSELLTFRDGEPFDLQIFNRSAHAVFIHVLDIGLTGQIELLYPVEGSGDRLQPDRSLRVGEKRGRDFEFYVPEVFPFEKPGGSAEGLQHLKVLATLEEADFSFLIQDGVKYLASGQGARPFRSPLEILLSDVIAGSGKREARPIQVSLKDGWTTVTRSLLLHRAE
jgi:hypothetical protein